MTKMSFKLLSYGIKFFRLKDVIKVDTIFGLTFAFTSFMCRQNLVLDMEAIV